MLLKNFSCRRQMLARFGYASLTREEFLVRQECIPSNETEELRSFDFSLALKDTPLYKTAKQKSSDFFKDKFMLAYSDSREKCAVEWEVCSSKGMIRWEELRHEKETNGNKSYAHDMYYAFQFLPWSPVINQGSDSLKHFLNLWNKQFPSFPTPLIPPLKDLKRLQGKDALTNGMWIILVRVPRPSHSKPHIPLSFRKDYAKYQDESEEDWQARKADIKRRAENEVHPTEAQLYITSNFTLLQEVGKHIVCSKCGSKGHHHEKSHNDVYAHCLEEEDFNSEQNITCFPDFPSWMNVLPFPKETIVLTKLLEENKGLTLQIRETETKIPLRLARKLLMDGLHIEGEVYASGIGTRKRVRREDELDSENSKSLDVTSKERKENYFDSLPTILSYKPLKLHFYEEEIS